MASNIITNIFLSSDSVFHKTYLDQRLPKEIGFNLSDLLIDPLICPIKHYFINQHIIL